LALPLALVAPAGLSSTGCKGKGGSGAGGSTAAKDRHVVVLFTSDEHSHLFGFSPERDDYPLPTAAGSGAIVGGVARRSVAIARERKAATAAGKDSILVSAGDNQMGCLPHLVFESKSIDYATMKLLGYDVTTFGNHEFDFGPGALANSIAAALSDGGVPPIVATNVHFSSGGADAALAAYLGSDPKDDKPVHAYRVLTTASGLKIGVIGYVGINAAHVAPNKTPVEFSVRPADPKTDGNVPAGLPALYADLQPVVDTLHQTEKVDLVIALAHGGVVDSSSQAGMDAGEDTQVCDNVSGIDFIVSGHAHNHDATPMQRTNMASGKPCLVLNGGALGMDLGRVEFTIPADASKGVTWDKTTQALLPIDDTTVPDPTLGPMVDTYIDAIESGGSSGATLATFLSHALGTTVKDDPTTHGDLYFMPVGKTSFDVTDTRAVLYLSADAMLSASDAWATANAGATTDLAVESAGVIRSSIKHGQTNVIAAADAFNVVPLGASPTDMTIGYPLIRAYVSPLELRAVVEFGLAQGAVNNDYNLGFGGLKVEYDATRPTVQKIADLFDATKGQVMRLTLDSNHANGFETFDKVVYDRAAMLDTTALVSIITSSYIGQFASDAGVTMKDATGMPLTLQQAIIHRADTSEIKQVEAFMGYLHGAPGGSLASTYDKTSSSFTKRWVCTAGC
jgi:5'-nucleotidase/UDP-sugar diphosphatase